MKICQRKLGLVFLILNLINNLFSQKVKDIPNEAEQNHQYQNTLLSLQPVKPVKDPHSEISPNFFMFLLDNIIDLDYIIENPVKSIIAALLIMSLLTGVILSAIGSCGLSLGLLSATAAMAVGFGFLSATVISTIIFQGCKDSGDEARECCVPGL